MVSGSPVRWRCERAVREVRSGGDVPRTGMSRDKGCPGRQGKGRSWERRLLHRAERVDDAVPVEAVDALAALAHRVLRSVAVLVVRRRATGVVRLRLEQ